MEGRNYATGSRVLSNLFFIVLSLQPLPLNEYCLWMEEKPSLYGREAFNASVPSLIQEE